MRVLITAGATRNRVDAIRYLSAHATGTTGVSLATQLSDLFAQKMLPKNIFLLGSAEARLRLENVTKNIGWKIAEVEEFFGTRDLMERMKLNVPSADVVIHSAAVGDYEVADATSGKIPSGQAEISLRLTPTPKILDNIRAWNPSCYLVSFKAAPPETTQDGLVRIARAQLERTGSNLVFANIIGKTEDVTLVGPTKSEQFIRPEAIETLAHRVLAHECKTEWPIRSK